RIARLVRDGAIVVGPKPARSPSLTGYPECDAAVRRLADEVWGEGPDDVRGNVGHRYGRGRVVFGQRLSLGAILANIQAKRDLDFTTPSAGARLSYIHRHAGDADIYFVSNQNYRSGEAACTFRVAGKVPEFWHPDTGAVETAPVYEEKAGQVTVPIH